MTRLIVKQGEPVTDMEEKLRQLQLCELEILDEFVRICDKHSLRYFLVGGTLLGAARHQGFIPWDDDIDVAMPRNDYDKFAELCREELDANYFYQSPKTDPHYFIGFAKLRKNETEINEEGYVNVQFHKGVFIDIFPLDDCPAPGIVCHLLYNVLAVIRYRGLVDSGLWYIPYRKIIGKLGYLALCLFSPKNLLWLREKLLRLSHKLSDGRYVASYFGAYDYQKEISSAEWYQNVTKLSFEQRNFAAPIAYDRVLRHSYGADYMVVPGEAERKSHNISLEKVTLFKK